MHVVTSLTVAAGKRLIAKGVAAFPPVKRALAQGTVAVGSGSTNGYIIEELTGEPFAKHSFVTGHTVPPDYRGPTIAYSVPDLVLRRGERMQLKAVDALKDMGPGDVFIKGANALNYERQQAGVLIGHPTGGNVGAVVGSTVSRRILYLHPVGLEKCVSVDLEEVARRINRDPEGKGPTLWVVPGMIFTEIEALRTLVGIEALPCGAGGIGGAEGAIWLALFGDQSRLDQALALLDTLKREPPFC